MAPVPGTAASLKDLGFGAHDMKVYQWGDFVERARLRFQDDGPQRSMLPAEGGSVPDPATLSLNRISENESASLVNRAMATQDGRHVLVQIKDGRSGEGKLTKRLLILGNSTLDSASAEKSTGPLAFLSYAARYRGASRNSLRHPTWIKACLLGRRPVGLHVPTGIVRRRIDHTPLLHTPRLGQQ